MNYQTLIIVLTLFIIAILIIAFWLASKCQELEEELNKKEESNKLVMPVAEVKAQFSEEDMKKIKELLNNAKPGSVKLGEPEEEKCKCEHFYDSIIIDHDIKRCCERLICHCQYCGHETVIPIRQGLLMDLIINGGKT